MKNLDLITDAIKAMNEGNNEVAESRLKQFITLNTPRVNGGKFKIYDWCDYKKKEYRPSMYGVFHDPEGVAVATNTRVLVISKPDFNSEKVGEVIDIKGDIVDSGRNKEGIAIFPAWRRVVAEKVERVLSVDRERLANLMSKARVDKKLGKEYLAFNIATEGTPVYVAPDSVKLMLTLPEGKFYSQAMNEEGEPIRPIQFESEDGNYTALFMPIAVKKEYIGRDAVALCEDCYNS